MRVTLIFAAAALAVAGPALAQDNEAVDANAAVTAGNMTVDANAALAGNVTVDNGIALDTMPIEEEAPAPAPARARKEEFPWGILGLIGLVGLFGRRRD